MLKMVRQLVSCKTALLILGTLMAIPRILAVQGSLFPHAKVLLTWRFQVDINLHLLFPGKFCKLGISWDLTRTSTQRSRHPPPRQDLQYAEQRLRRFPLGSELGL